MNLLRLFRQSLFSSGAACKRTLARNTRRLLPVAAALLFAATAQAQEVLIGGSSPTDLRVLSLTTIPTVKLRLR